MPTYLLTWNPERWQWNYIQKSIAQIETDGFCFEPWSVGVTKKIHTGDRVFLMKLGEKPRGISASGWVTSDTYEDKHWGDSSKTALYVDVHFDTIIDPNQESIFSIELLQDKIYSGVNWTPQASGMIIPDNVAENLEKDWAKFLNLPVSARQIDYADEVNETKTFHEETTDALEELLDEFLNRWQIEDVEKMTLQEYVSVKNKDTFCQWIETKTRVLGSIKGMISIKFGIYERKDPNEKPKNYANDNKYSWLRAYGNNRNEVFEKVKKDILEVIRLSVNGQFDKIDDIILPDLFKWKIAFLYSNERLIPIYKRDALFAIARHYGLKTNGRTKISEIQEVMIANKPSDKNVYAYMIELSNRFIKGDQKDSEERKSQNEKRNAKVTRQASIGRNIQPHRRTINRSYIVEQKHNKIQEALKSKLVKEYGKENVVLEENYVDVKLIQPNYIGLYEVKSSSYASECIREALGQILFYSYHDQDKRTKKIYVVGQYPANEQDNGYIEYIKDKLKLDFEYLNIEFE